MKPTLFFRSAVTVCLLGAFSARAQTANPYLSQAKVFFQGLDFEKCVKRLNAAAKWKANSNETLAEVQLYLGLCKLGLNKDAEAAEHFERSVSLNRDIELPPLQSPKTRAFFESAKTRMEKTLGLAAKPAPIPMAPTPSAPVPVPDAPKQATLVPQPTSETTPDMVAPAPQGKRLAAPIALAGTSAVAAGLAAYFGVQAKSLEGQANAANFQSDAVTLGQRARTQALLSNSAWGVAGATAAAAVITYFVLN